MPAPIPSGVIDARVARLATADAEGRPHAVPICFAISKRTLYFAVDRKPKSGRPLRRIENIRANPRVTVIVDHYEEDWERLWWVRLDGDARILDGGPESAAALRALAAKYPQYLEQPPPGPVLAVDIRAVSTWSGGR